MKRNEMILGVLLLGTLVFIGVDIYQDGDLSSKIHDLFKGG